MGIFVSDTFSGESSSVAISSHTGETGATWTRHTSYTAEPYVSSANQDCYGGAAGSTACAAYASGSPSSADYTVSATITSSGSAGSRGGLAARMSTSANTFYMARLAPTAIELYKAVAGTFSLLGSYTVSVGSYAVEFILSGSSLKVNVGGTERISATDSAITAAGSVGVRYTYNGGDCRIDSFVATDAGAATVKPWYYYRQQ